MNTVKTSVLNNGLLQFITESPSAFHAATSMAKRLQKAGFERLFEADAWQLTPGKRYYVLRNDSSIIGFVYGEKPLAENGIRMVGAHTDSPCLKVKPNALVNSAGYDQLGVEVYGGALLHTWFDRDLSLAGRVSYRDNHNKIASVLIDCRVPLAVIPSLAIHLDREANRNHSINPQEDIRPILQLAASESNSNCWQTLLQQQLSEQHPSLMVEEILSSEINLYDTQAPAMVGLRGEFIASARLDNLLSCYLGLDALLQADTEVSSLLICTDHEEIGSASACGAKGPMLEQFLQRLMPDTEQRLRMIDRSLMISADNAHGVHPNFKQRHDGQHGPLLNAGPVIKINANQRYATNSETSAHFKNLCTLTQTPVQNFVVRTDMECGSTIGPITAAEVGVKTLDIGVPTFAMHSIRELAGAADTEHLQRVLVAFYHSQNPPGQFS